MGMDLLELVEREGFLVFEDGQRRRRRWRRLGSEWERHWRTVLSFIGALRASERERERF